MILKRLSLAAAFALAVVLAPLGAFAQSSPGLVYGQVPTAAQWNSYFSRKQDYSAAAVTGPGVAVAGHIAKWGVYPALVDGGAAPTFIAGTGITISNGPSCVAGCTIAATGSGLPAQAANTVLGNFTASSAAPVANAVPTCAATGGNHLNYTLGSGFSCGTNNAGVTTFSAGTTGLTPSSATSGTVTLAGTLAIANGGTGATAAPAARAGLGVEIEQLSAATFTASGGPVVTLPSGYTTFRLIWSELVNASGASVYIQYSFDGGSTYKAGASDYSYAGTLNASAGGGNSGTNAAIKSYVIPGSLGSTANKNSVIDMNIYMPQTSGFGTTWDSKATYWTATTILEVDNMGGQIVAGYGTPTNIRLVPDGGVTISGRYTLIGYR